MNVMKKRLATIINSPYFIGTMFALLLFIKCVLFNWFGFHHILVASLWNSPTSFWGYYLPKLAISIGVASFAMLCNRKWVLIVLSILVDIWIIANLMYIRSYGMIIDSFSITMLGNLRGFESSLPLYLRLNDIVYPIFTLLFVLLVSFTHTHMREPKLYIVFVCSLRLD